MRINFHISDIESGDVQRVIESLADTHTVFNWSFLRYWQDDEGDKVTFSQNVSGMKDFDIRDGSFYWTDIFGVTRRMTPVRERTDAGSGAFILDVRRKDYVGLL